MAFKPLIESLKNIETVVSQTVENVAANSAYIEIDNLVERKDRLLKDNPQPDASVITVLVLGGIIALIGMCSISSNIKTGLIMVLVGSVLACFGYIGSCKYHRKITYWEAEILPKMSDLDEKIASKRSEIEKIERKEV